jgi:hypothetical protein
MRLGDDGSYIQYGLEYEEGADGGGITIYYEEAFPVETLAVIVSGDTPLIWLPNHTNRFSFEVRRLDGADEPTQIHYIAVGR